MGKTRNSCPKEPMVSAKGKFDFRLNADELAKFKRNGFVVSERMGAANFIEMYYRIYERDMPVFVSADAILHAWHHSYDAMLEEIEMGYLHPSLVKILSSMHDKIPDAHKEYGQGILQDSVKDADYFLAVAMSLLQGQPAATRLNQDERVKKTLKRTATDCKWRNLISSDGSDSLISPNSRFAAITKNQRFLVAISRR